MFSSRCGIVHLWHPSISSWAGCLSLFHYDRSFVARMVVYHFVAIYFLEGYRHIFLSNKFFFPTKAYPLGYIAAAWSATAAKFLGVPSTPSCDPCSRVWWRTT